ncbi:BTAD domain-containing putative transcriptional regulator [Kibdelosporangium persicum]|uniref:Transcriptional regulatory protein, C terminal n=1 Tax=Kibdelosporangium persicum TaxID=2698649 RepID=A0ABX2F6K6_9PSEU|nr:BTAD domain-containing putative transcriptional regulator [Kibdelosporangium persicum]NRN66892.1 Transcriptional regulatory protein, C terminal [Kibdelosporangium persicum]
MQIRCLGDFSVEIDGRPVLHWRAGKARSLFQYLLVNRGRLVSAHRLREVLWPERDVSPQSSSLKVAMHAVRKMLAPHDEITIEHDNGYYRLTTRDVRIDFEDLARCASAARQAGDAAVPHHRRVVELYSGEFLAGEHADWVVEHREWCKALVLHSLRQISADALRENDYLHAIEASKRILEIDPCAEGAYQTLMIMHARLGELGRVHSWYQLCARRLRAELDVEPTRLTRRILAGSMRGDLRATAA